MDRERKRYHVYLIDAEEFHGPGRLSELRLPDDMPAFDVINGAVLTAPQCALCVPAGTSHPYASLDVCKQMAERQREQCAQNLKRIWAALRAYAHDHEDHLPRSGKWVQQFEGKLNLHALFPRHLVDLSAFLCPSHGYDDWARVGARTSYCYRPGRHEWGGPS